MCFYEFFKVFGYFLEIKCDDAGIINYYLFIIYTPEKLRYENQLISKAYQGLGKGVRILFDHLTYGICILYLYLLHLYPGFYCNTEGATPKILDLLTETLLI